MVTRKALVALASAGLVFGSTAAAAAPAAADVRVASPVAPTDLGRGLITRLGVGDDSTSTEVHRTTTGSLSCSAVVLGAGHAVSLS